MRIRRHGNAVILEPIARDWAWLDKVIGPLDDDLEIEALRFEVLPFDQEDARHAGELRAILAASSTPIGPYDVLIAGQAITRGVTLITHNVREFQPIVALKVEDWQT